MATSFKKKTTLRGRPPALPNGTKPSLNNNQLLISTGIPSLDSVIGGGLAIGTVLLVEEDLHKSYTNVLHKIFLGEAIACDQHLFLATLDKDPQQFLLEVPCTLEEVQESNQKKEQDKENLHIAWRYQNKPKVESVHGPKSSFGHYFDLSSHIDEDKLQKINYTCFCPENYPRNRHGKHVNQKYKELIKEIKIKIERGNLYTANSTSISSILRVSLCSIGSPLWNEDLINSYEYDHSLAWFLTSLRSLMRSSFSACMVSIPMHLFENKAYVSRIRHCCDKVVRLESFPDFQQNPIFKEYHGLFHVEKLSSLNCINGQNVDASDLAFKLKRKRFTIEKFHLPPDISETASRSQQNNPTNNKLTPGTSLCSVSTPVNNLLEF